jgi:hypothetical protein
MLFSFDVVVVDCERFCFVGNFSGALKMRDGRNELNATDHHHQRGFTVSPATGGNCKLLKLALKLENLSAMTGAKKKL